MILLKIIILSLFTQGVVYFIRDNVKGYGEPKKYSEWYYKPLFTCTICAASLWGSLGYALMPEPSLLLWPVVVGAVAALNNIIGHHYEI